MSSVARSNLEGNSLRIAVIPARGGSKRIPRKNIRLFAGKPMISYAIGAARESGLFDRVVVSTDDSEIAEISKLLGADVPFYRPADLSDDHTPTVPVIAHAIRQCQMAGLDPTEVCCIYPGVPFIRASDLAEALQLLLQRDRSGYAFPVTPFPAAIQRALRRSSDGGVEPFDSHYVNTRTQDLESAFHDAGQFYWGGVSAWLSGLSIHAHGAAIVLPEWRVVDIDTEDDWRRAEIIFGAVRDGSVGGMM
jgi:pseudaminic acid cytidylyltransferase